MTDAPDPVDAFSLLRGRADDTAHLKRLRFAVIAMGFLMALGFATVIGRIFYLMTRTPPPATDGNPVPAAMASDIEASLPAGARAIQQSLSGSQLSILYEGPDGQGVVIVDLSSGREAGRVLIRPLGK